MLPGEKKESMLTMFFMRAKPKYPESICGYTDVSNYEADGYTGESGPDDAPIVK